MQELMVSAKSLAFKKEYADKYEISTEDFESATLDDLGNFIINTLYPIIENQYKIKKYNVGICGSSAGGNAALYLGMKYSNIFSFIFTLTPAIGFYTDEALTKFFKSHVNEEIPQPEIYFFQGVNCDLEKLLAHLNLNLVQNLLEAGIKKENIVTYIEQDAEHNEDAWRFVVNYFMNIHAQKILK
jgi:predicted alpha/beta superfamily hydrolase